MLIVTHYSSSLIIAHHHSSLIITHYLSLLIAYYYSLSLIITHHPPLTHHHSSSPTHPSIISQGAPTIWCMQICPPNEEKWVLCASTKEDYVRWCQSLEKFVRVRCLCEMVVQSVLHDIFSNLLSLFFHLTFSLSFPLQRSGSLITGGGGVCQATRNSDFFSGRDSHSHNTHTHPNPDPNPDPNTHTHPSLSPNTAMANELCMTKDALPTDFKFFQWATVRIDLLISVFRPCFRVCVPV